MVKVNFVSQDGSRHEVESPEGTSVMQAAVDNGVDGIDGDCGGVGACATCHVRVSDGWRSHLGSRSDLEDSMLSFLPDVSDNDRLGCQILLREELDDIEFQLPVEQY